MTPKEKSLSLSYVLAQLLIDNLDVVLLEKSDDKDQDLGQLKDKLIKLRSSTKNAYRILERNIEGSSLYELKNDIELTLDTLWS